MLCAKATHTQFDGAAVALAIQCPAKLDAQIHINRRKVAVHDLCPEPERLPSISGSTSSHACKGLAAGIVEEPASMTALTVSRYA
jgi:hypothetical protein